MDGWMDPKMWENDGQEKLYEKIWTVGRIQNMKKIDGWLDG